MKKALLPFAAACLLIFLFGACSRKAPPPQYSAIKDYDGNIYKVIQIGTQYWMTANLRTTHYADGTPLFKGTTISGGYTPVSDTTRAYYNWGQTPDSVVANLGYYYNWAAVMNGSASSNASPSGVQGPCPNGYHVPSDAEYQTLINYLGGADTAGGLMKGYILWENGERGYASEYASGFNALPAGLITPIANAGRDGWAYIWTTTARDSVTAHFMFLAGDSASVTDSVINIKNALSCRCLQN